MSRLHLLGSLVPVLVVPAVIPSDPPATAKLVVVKMVDVSATEYRFEPAQVTLAPGDTLRFVQTAATPHNVDLRGTPAGAQVGAAQMGPYLTVSGDSYSLVMDARFPAGTYQYVCTPHEMLGMKATFTVENR